MSDEKFERLSAFMDGEVDFSQSELKQLTSDNELMSRWKNYHVIREAMTQHVNLPVSDGWFSELHARIDNEPTVLAPTNVASRSQKVFKQVAGFAVAATVATIAIVSLQSNQLDPAAPTQELAQVKPVNTVTQPRNAIATVSTSTLSTNAKLSNAAASKLSGYIVNHYEHSVTGKLQGMLPYMRIVSVTPVVRITNER